MAMYNLYLGSTLFPVTPSKIEYTVSGNNKTVDLISGGEVNIPKTRKLKEISFEIMLPNQQYPFATYTGTFHHASYYIEKLRKLKNQKTPFKFKLIRRGVLSFNLSDTSMKVTLEKYTVVEDADNGLDVTVSIELKEWRDYKAKKIVKGKAKTPTETYKFLSKWPKNGIYKVKKGDTLLNIAKAFYGQGSAKSEIYKKNKKVIEKAAKKHGRKSSSKGLHIYKGTKLRLPTNLMFDSGESFSTK